MTEPDALRILGLSTATSVDEVKRAWRRVVKQTHPDLHPNDPRANERFQLVQEAYDLLRIRLENGRGPITMQSDAPPPPRPTYYPFNRDTQPIRYSPPAARPATQRQATRRPARVAWAPDRGTWRWWLYVAAWRFSAVPFAALLVVGVVNHRQIVSVQDAFRNAPTCGRGATSDAHCMLEQDGVVTAEDCSSCAVPAKVGRTPAITVSVNGYNYDVRVLAEAAAAKTTVYAFDHGTADAAKVTVRFWNGALVAVGGLPTTDSPALIDDWWVKLVAAMVLPIAFILLAPVRIVDLTFRLVFIVAVQFFRMIGLALARA